MAAGSLAKLLLREFEYSCAELHNCSYYARLERIAKWEEIQTVCNDLDSPLRCVDSAAEAKMRAEVDHVQVTGDSIGGVFEVVARGLPPGLGTHAQWDEKLDAGNWRAR